ncbi:MAG: hypothetical protein IJU92_04130, partial [Spirochaetaceae bacterium]|nr:hypothetical protein [Spirochaetaceae bacterium]
LKDNIEITRSIEKELREKLFPGKTFVSAFLKSETEKPSSESPQTGETSSTMNTATSPKAKKTAVSNNEQTATTELF